MCYIGVIILFIFLFYSIKYSKKIDKAKKLLRKMDEIYLQARKEEIDKPQVDEFFECSDKAIALLPQRPKKNTPEAVLKEKIEKMSDQLSLILAARAPSASLGNDIDKLASLRKMGMISDDEFKAFSERFKLSTGQKAEDIIKAISDLHQQYRKGAMSEGNYHAGLWSLLDKLDRKI